MKDLLVIAEAQIAEKQCKEIEEVKKRIEQDREMLKQAIELVNSHTLYKKVTTRIGYGYKYVLATEEMLKEDYLGEPQPYRRAGISFYKSDWDSKPNRGIMEVNGNEYYDIRFLLNDYEKTLQEKKRQLLSRTSEMQRELNDYEKKLEALKRDFPTIKEAITEWLEYQKEIEEGEV